MKVSLCFVECLEVVLEVHGLVFFVLIHVIVCIFFFDLFPTGFFHVIN